MRVTSQVLALGFSRYRRPSPPGTVHRAHPRQHQGCLLASSPYRLHHDIQTSLPYPLFASLSLPFFRGGGNVRPRHRPHDGVPEHCRARLPYGP
jgi:hypothetical protein